jgi:hypothetical protein
MNIFIAHRVNAIKSKIAERFALAVDNNPGRGIGSPPGFLCQSLLTGADKINLTRLDNETNAIDVLS